MSDINREVVSVGLDFRPIPIDIGDGKVWGFNPDPDPAELDNLMRALRAVGKAGKEVESVDGEGVEFEKVLRGLSEAIGQLIVDPEQKKEWLAKRSYGLGALSGLTSVLMEQVSGFPQKSDGGSGKPSGKSGRTGSRGGTGKG